MPGHITIILIKIAIIVVQLLLCSYYNSTLINFDMGYFMENFRYLHSNQSIGVTKQEILF